MEPVTPRRRGGAQSTLLRFLFLLLLGGLGALLVRAFLIEGISIATDSMAPALSKDLHVMVNKLAYVRSSPRRGDVILFPSPLGDKDFVKRVIAVGGDTIEIRKKKVFLNGQLLEEPYAQFVRPDTILEGDDILPMVVPEGALFVLGDNRDVSNDSRDWKTSDGQWIPFLPVSAVKGRVLVPQ